VKSFEERLYHLELMAIRANAKSVIAAAFTAWNTRRSVAHRLRKLKMEAAAQAEEHRLQAEYEADRIIFAENERATMKKGAVLRLQAAMKAHRARLDVAQALLAHRQSAAETVKAAMVGYHQRNETQKVMKRRDLGVSRIHASVWGYLDRMSTMEALIMEEAEQAVLTLQATLAALRVRRFTMMRHARRESSMQVLSSVVSAHIVRKHIRCAREVEAKRVLKQEAKERQETQRKAQEEEEHASRHQAAEELASLEQRAERKRKAEATAKAAILAAVAAAAQAVIDTAPLEEPAYVKAFLKEAGEAREESAEDGAAVQTKAKEAMNSSLPSATVIPPPTFGMPQQAVVNRRSRPLPTREQLLTFKHAAQKAAAIATSHRHQSQRSKSNEIETTSVAMKAMAGSQLRSLFMAHIARKKTADRMQVMYHKSITIMQSLVRGAHVRTHVRSLAKRQPCTSVQNTLNTAHTSVEKQFFVPGRNKHAPQTPAPQTQTPAEVCYACFTLSHPCS